MGKYRLPRAQRRSAIAPFIPGEPWQGRHARRKATAEARREAVERWCRPRDVQLTISNDGHHWTLARGDNVAEWWPSSARLVIGRRYRRPLKVYDHEQLFAAIGKVFRGQ